MTALLFFRLHSFGLSNFNNIVCINVIFMVRPNIFGLKEDHINTNIKI